MEPLYYILSPDKNWLKFMPHNSLFKQPLSKYYAHLVREMLSWVPMTFLHLRKFWF